jgi:uncharacterized membrane protein
MYILRISPVLAAVGAVAAVATTDPNKLMWWAGLIIAVASAVVAYIQRKD